MSLNVFREFLKDSIRLQVDFNQTEQSRGVPMPPVEKPYPTEAALVLLPDWYARLNEKRPTLVDVILARKSQRQFSDLPITMEELSFMLWATQGVRARSATGTVQRTVPSAGNRHSFETYLTVQQVTGLISGIYRYLPLEHALLPLGPLDNLAIRVTDAARGQTFVGKAAVTFFWTAIPGRTEWRYAEASHKVIAIDVGHVCQNLYLAAQAVDCGTCAVAAYNQDIADQLLGVDGQDEFVIYIAPVGHLR